MTEQSLSNGEDGGEVLKVCSCSCPWLECFSDFFLVFLPFSLASFPLLCLLASFGLYSTSPLFEFCFLLFAFYLFCFLLVAVVPACIESCPSLPARSPPTAPSRLPLLKTEYLTIASRTRPDCIMLYLCTSIFMCARSVPATVAVAFPFATLLLCVPAGFSLIHPQLLLHRPAPSSFFLFLFSLFLFSLSSPFPSLLSFTSSNSSFSLALVFLPPPCPVRPLPLDLQAQPSASPETNTHSPPALVLHKALLCSQRVVSFCPIYSVPFSAIAALSAHLGALSLLAPNYSHRPASAWPRIGCSRLHLIPALRRTFTCSSVAGRLVVTLVSSPRPLPIAHLVAAPPFFPCFQGLALSTPTSTPFDSSRPRLTVLL